MIDILLYLLVYLLLLVSDEQVYVDLVARRSDVLAANHSLMPLE